MPLHRCFPLILVASLCTALTAVAETAPSGLEAPSLVTHGDPERGIKPCSECHQPNGDGSESVGAGEHFPALAGQPFNYLVGQIA